MGARHGISKFLKDDAGHGSRAHDRFILAEVFGYYGLIGAAAVSALFLH